MLRRNWVLLGSVCLAIGGIAAANATAATYNESVSGDISNNQLIPTILPLTVGSNSIIGSVNGSGGDSQDFIDVVVPAGAQMTSYINAAYSSGGDVQGFTGFAVGSTFPSSPFAAGSYAGYSHFGTGATNGGSPDGINGGAPTTTVGVNLLSAGYMPSNATPSSTAAGATGFTTPLGAGDYTFLIQQLGGATNYEFDITVVPEPGSLCLMAIGGLLLVTPAARKCRRKSC